jgi:uncharacterized protein (TIGR02597 family)
MKNKLLSLGLSLLVVNSVSAAQVISEPVGFLRVNIPPSTLSTFSFPLQKNPVDVGTVTAVGTSTLTDSKSVWVSGQLSTTTKPHLIKILTGSAAGRVYLITANTTNQLTVDAKGGNLASSIAVGARYQIFPARTLGNTFGTTTVPFQKSSSTTTADTLQLWNGTAWDSYYHNGTNWLKSGSTVNQNNAIIYPDEAVQISRRGTTALTLTMAGEVSVISEQTQCIAPGMTFAANRYPVNATLSSLGLKLLPNWISGSSTTTADYVRVRIGGGWATYWHNGTSWVKSGSTVSQNSAVIPEGGGYYVHRKSSSVGVNNFATQTKPY